MPTREALLLIGHGSARFPEAGSILHRHAETLRQSGYAVAVGFLNGPPSVEDALAELAGKPARMVPFFMEDGYFTRVAIPHAVSGTAVQICPPVGLHPAMPTLIERQGLTACERLGIPPSQAAVLIIGHGSASAPGRALALHRHAAGVAATGRFVRVETACLEEPPFIADVLAASRAHPVIAVGFFANLGSHVRDDVPALLHAERAARGTAGPPVHFACTVTEDPALAGIVLDQAGYNKGEI